ncbi:outer membrane protein TOM13-domain-containing protein [Lipomyces oligophaga]|uniref:outer membrane protein TOM13-domain-containing protein n=1 Tax=Lipomyces oligophaga TaxID=45792 RepID=UPI0034CD1B9E
MSSLPVESDSDAPHIVQESLPGPSDKTPEQPELVEEEQELSDPHTNKETATEGFKPWLARSLGTAGSLLRFSSIQLLFPFINGVMLGFGEIFANELGIRWGFIGADVHPMRINIRNQVDRRLQQSRDKR